MENKYGGINDLPRCNQRIYNLWYQMLRRCYDEKQQSRIKGRSYSNCSVSNEWKMLSNFERDIKKLKGYKNWEKSNEYCLDKDIKVKGNRIYGKDFCQFVSKKENVKYIYESNPHNVDAMQKARLTKYILKKGKETLAFNSEKSACEYLGVRQSSVCSCYKKGYKCKGYTIYNAKMDLE